MLYPTVSQPGGTLYQSFFQRKDGGGILTFAEGLTLSLLPGEKMLLSYMPS